MKELLAQATEYSLLAPLPGVTKAGSEATSTFATYIPGMFNLVIGVAGVLAVVMIIYGGIQYMSTDAFQGKSDAKDTISNALWGLLLTISAWLILFTVNPNLVNFNLNIEQQDLPLEGLNRPGLPGVGTPSVNRSDCLNCTTTVNGNRVETVVGVRHKPAPQGCAAPGPCIINNVLNENLKALARLEPQLLVTESFPPTRAHEARCHYDGTCVDVTVVDRTASGIARFIRRARENAGNLRAVYEVPTETRARELRVAGSLSESQVIVVLGITGEHFSVYLPSIGSGGRSGGGGATGEF